ncbi:MAG: hypothetical protein M3Y21_05570, partial [Candidatus Eremiobacteraeota bacterium]|nr:hypothetical protein [Candidatus Eremiobacteraeota bacterium]
MLFAAIAFTLQSVSPVLAYAPVATSVRQATHVHAKVALPAIHVKRKSQLSHPARSFVLHMQSVQLSIRPNTTVKPARAVSIRMPVVVAKAECANPNVDAKATVKVPPNYPEAAREEAIGFASVKVRVTIG